MLLVFSSLLLFFSSLLFLFSYFYFSLCLNLLYFAFYLSYSKLSLSLSLSLSLCIYIYIYISFLFSFYFSPLFLIYFQFCSFSFLVYRFISLYPSYLYTYRIGYLCTKWNSLHEDVYVSLYAKALEERMNTSVLLLALSK